MGPDPDWNKYYIWSDTYYYKCLPAYLLFDGVERGSVNEEQVSVHQLSDKQVLETQRSQDVKFRMPIRGNADLLCPLNRERLHYASGMQGG